MIVSHSRIDLAECFRRQQPPAAIIDKAENEQWLVSYDAIRMDRPIVWATTRREGQVYIPLVPYLIRPEADLALAFMLQLGMRVSFELGRPVQRLHVATGVPVSEVTDPNFGTMWQYYAGFGVVVA
jgi:hypothetical protein